MPEVDYNALRFALDLLQLLGLAAIGVYTWLINRSKANRAAIGELERQATSHAERLAIIEQQIAQAPTHTDLGKVYDRLNGVAETLSQLNGQLNGVTHQLSMVNEYLLNQGAKK